MILEADAAPEGKCFSVDGHKLSGSEAGDPDSLPGMAERDREIADRINLLQHRSRSRIYDRNGSVPCVAHPDTIVGDQQTLAAVGKIHDDCLATVNIDQGQRSRIGIGYRECPGIRCEAEHM